MMRGVAVWSIAACLLAGCTPPSTEVGEVVVFWSEGNSADGVGEFDGSTTLFPDQSAWDAWVLDLPAGMREARAEGLAGVSLVDSVAVVTVANICTGHMRVVHRGEGRLSAELVGEDPNTNCVWSPMQVTVWDVPLDVLGVDHDDVLLED